MQIQSIKTRYCFFYFGKQRTPRDVIIRKFDAFPSIFPPTYLQNAHAHQVLASTFCHFYSRGTSVSWETFPRKGGGLEVAENPCRDLATIHVVGEKMGENFGQIIYDDNCATVLFVTYFRRTKIMCVLFLQRYKVSNHKYKLKFFLKLKIETIKFVGKIYFALLPDFFFTFPRNFRSKILIPLSQPWSSNK
jgi:hypothetical protein